MGVREGGKAVILIACTALKTVMDLDIMANTSASNEKLKTSPCSIIGMRHTEKIKTTNKSHSKHKLFGINGT